MLRALVVLASGVVVVRLESNAPGSLISGIIADATGGLALAFILPATCYAVIAGFGWYARRPASGTPAVSPDHDMMQHQMAGL